MNAANIETRQTILSNGTRHVSIWSQDGRLTATLFVGHADFSQSLATPMRWTGKTGKGARKWAEKMLASGKQSRLDEIDAQHRANAERAEVCGSRA